MLNLNKLRYVLVAFLCLTLHSQTVLGESIKVGPELEVQKAYVQNFLNAVDWPIVEQRWNSVLNQIALNSDPHMRIWFHLLFSGEPPELGTEIPDAKILSFLQNRGPKLIDDAKNDPKLALRIAEFTEFFIEEYKKHKDSVTSTHSKIFQEFSQFGIFSLKDDPAHEYRVKRDHDVFEMTRYPPLEGVENTQAWTNRARVLLSIPSESLPAQSLNPHYHLSRYIRTKPGSNEIEELNIELRALTALFTIHENDPNATRAARPFYGGMNSANAYWADGELYPAAQGRGNVRLIPSETIEGLTELRQEFRSLGNIPWSKIYPFLEEIELAFQGNSVDLVRKSIRGLIARRFESISPEVLALAIKNSGMQNAAASASAEMQILKFKSVEDYLKLFKGTIYKSLVEIQGPVKAATFFDEKWKKIDAFSAAFSSDVCIPLRKIIQNTSHAKPS